MLATQLLAPKVAGPILLIGAGVLGHAHLEAFLATTGVTEFTIASRTRDSARRLARVGEAIGARCTVVPVTAIAARTAAVIVTMTSSRLPVLADEVSQSVFVAAVGAHQPNAAELPATLVRRAKLYVDTIAGAIVEAGDFIQAEIDWSHVTRLEATLGTQSRTGPIVFKSVGDALWDLAAARLAFQHLG